MCAMFAVTYPQRVSALIMAAGYARLLAAPDYDFGRTPEQHDAFLAQIARDWGGPMGMESRMPSRADDPRLRQRWAHYLRSRASPPAAAALVHMNAKVDIRHMLPSIRVPTLVLHSVNDQAIDFRHGRYLAEHIPGAKLVELQGVLATVLFTDIVGYTERAVALGNRASREGVQRHHPASAVRCACAIVQAVRSLGIELRIGLHTGECEVMDDKYPGIAVHIGARAAARSTPGEVLVSAWWQRTAVLPVRLELQARTRRCRTPAARRRRGRPAQRARGGAGGGFWFDAGAGAAAPHALRQMPGVNPRLRRDTRAMTHGRAPGRPPAARRTRAAAPAPPAR